MSLTGALQIGQSALVANQAAIEVTGNNLANVGSRGYHRQSIALQPAPVQEMQGGVFIGRGVQVQQIVRQVDDALEGRLRTATSDQSAASARQDVLSQIESLQNEMSGTDLSTQLASFFNSWSQVANQPLDNSQRTLVLQQGQTLAGFIQDLRQGLSDQRTQLDQTIDQAASAANDLLTQIQQVNQQVSLAETGGGTANSLRDQRDQLLGQLSQYVDISVHEQNNGSVDIYVGSLPIMLGGQSRGLQVRRQTVNGQLQIDVVLGADGSVLQATSGKIGAAIKARQQDLNPAFDKLDEFAGQLINQVNKVYSQGQGLTGFTSVTGDYRSTDPTKALNDPASGLTFTPVHGSFQLHVTQLSTGQSVASTINVKLDGTNTPADTSLNDLAAQINAVPNLQASVTADGRLSITSANGDYQFSFSDDSSGALAALGVNTFFQGSDAHDIAVNDTLNQDPSKLALAQGGITGDNTNALALAGLRTQPLSDLGGISLSDLWTRHVSDYAVRAGQANQAVTSTGVVHDSLTAQQQSVSGVNTDEEAINLMAYQRAYQASARFLTVVDTMMQTLLAIT